MSKSAQKQCQQCGKMFMRHMAPWEKLTRFKTRMFCSRSCADIAKRGKWLPRNSRGRFMSEGAGA
jgi:hypothetical protein